MNPAVAEDYLRRVMTFCLCGLAFTLPLSIAVSSIFYFLLLGIYILAGAWTFRLWPPTFGLLEKTFLVFWILSILSGLFGVSPRHSIRDLGDDLYFLLLILAGALLTTESQRHKVLQFFIAGGLVAALWGVIQYIVGVDQSNDTGGFFIHLPRALEGWPRSLLDHLSMVHGRVVGTRSHPLTYAETLLFPLALSLSLLMVLARASWRHVAATWLLSVALLLSKSRGPWLAAITMVGVLLSLAPWRVWRRRVWFLILPVMLVFLLPSLRSRGQSIADLQHAANAERLRMWKVGGAIFKDHPVLGIGPGNMKRVSPQYQTDSDREGGPWGHLHNTFVHMAAERGLPALGAWIGLLLILGRAFLGAWRTATPENQTARIAAMTGLLVLASFVVSGFTETNYNDSEVLMMFYFSIGLLLSWVRHAKPDA